MSLKHYNITIYGQALALILDLAEDINIILLLSTVY